MPSKLPNFKLRLTDNLDQRKDIDIAGKKGIRMLSLTKPLDYSTNVSTCYLHALACHFLDPASSSATEFSSRNQSSVSVNLSPELQETIVISNQDFIGKFVSNAAIGILLKVATND